MTEIDPLDGFTTRIEIKSGYDYRDDPNDQYGAHGAELHLILTGPLGVIVARISTGWMSAPIVGPYIRGGKQVRSSKPGMDDGLIGVYPSGNDVLAHSPTAREHWNPNGGECPYTGDSYCWTTGGLLVANDVLAKLIAGGDKAAFEFLAECYAEWFVVETAVAEDIATR